MTDFDALLDDVYQRHRQRLLERVAALRAAVRAADADAAARDEGWRIAHGLAGSLGTLGFPGLSTRARAVELALRGGGSAAPLAADVDAVHAELSAATTRPR